MVPLKRKLTCTTLFEKGLKSSEIESKIKVQNLLLGSLSIFLILQGD